MQIRKIAMLAVSAAAIAAPASAQRIGPQQVLPPAPGAPMVHTLNPLPAAPVAARWGHKMNGRWEGGYRAPGGWSAYRRPVRGWTLPRYWIAPSFVIADYAYYGLSTPPYGYNWVRYYDDAVLVDGRGRVWETSSPIEWDRYENSYYADGGSYQQQYGSSYSGGYSERVDTRYADRLDTRYGDRDARYGAGYPAPGYRPAPPPVVTYAPPQAVVQPLPPSGYSQTYSAGGYASGVTVNGVWYPAPPAGTSTTITVQSAPVVTTTVTEYVTEREVRTVRKVWRKPVRKWHPRPKPRCVCRVVGS